MKFWTYKVSSWTRAEIQEAVKDESWQRFRRSLKGLSTESKLDNLFGYCVRRVKKRTWTRAHQVRVDNYINALLRGGQLIRCADGTIRVQR